MYYEKICVMYCSWIFKNLENNDKHPIHLRLRGLWNRWSTSPPDAFMRHKDTLLSQSEGIIFFTFSEGIIFFTFSEGIIFFTFSEGVDYLNRNVVV